MSLDLKSLKITKSFNTLSLPDRRNYYEPGTEQFALNPRENLKLCPERVKDTDRLKVVDAFPTQNPIYSGIFSGVIILIKNVAHCSV